MLGISISVLEISIIVAMMSIRASRAISLSLCFSLSTKLTPTGLAARIFSVPFMIGWARLSGRNGLPSIMPRRISIESGMEPRGSTSNSLHRSSRTTLPKTS